MATVDDIRQYFANILQRSGTEVTDAEINAYVSAVNSGALTLAQARTALAQSPEGQDVQDVVRLYQTVFGRVPDQAGLNNQVDTLRGPATEADLANSFAASPEFTARFGGNTVNTAFINAVYQQVLGRTPSSAEVNFYLNSGFSAGRIALAFSESPEFTTASQAAVNAFLDAAGQGTAVYSGSLGGTGGLPTNPGSSFVFTDKIDALTGTTGNDIFIADNSGTAATATAADSVNGGAGIDTLNFFGAAAGPVTLPTLTGVEVVNFNAPQGGITANVAANTDVTTVGLVNSGTNTSTFTINATQGVSYTGVTGGTQTVTTTDADTAITAVVSGSTLGTLNLNGVGVTTLDVVSTGSSANTIAALASTGTETTVTVSGSQKLTVTGALADSVKTVNASANTGGVTVTLGTSDTTVTGGSGNDRFVFGGTLTTGDTVVGGAGTDIISVVGANYTTAVAGGVLPALNTKVTGVETLEFTGGAATTISGTTFTNTEVTKILFNTTNTDTVNAAGSARTYAFGELNTGAATLNGNADVTTFNVSLEGITGNGGNVGALTANFTNNTAAQVGTGTINLSSIGTNDAANVNSTGVITGQSNAGALTSTAVVVTGSHDLTIDGLGTAGSINAASFTGKLIATGSGFQDTITGGTGNDTINATVGGDTYRGGAGADTFTFTAINQGSRSTLTTLGDFATGTDKVNVAAIVAGTPTVNTTAVNVTAAADFTGALDIASAGNGGVNSAISYFQFGTDTFLVVDNSVDATFNTTTDAVIRVTGLVNFTATDVVLA